MCREERGLAHVMQKEGAKALEDGNAEREQGQTLGRITRMRRWLAGDGAPLLIVVGAILSANILVLSGVIDENPINWLSGLVVASHGALTAGQNTIDPSVGWITQALGHYAATVLLHGHVPWWNPYEGLGSPLVGEMGSAALFPTTLLMVFANGHLYGVVILELIAGVATYYLARHLAMNRWAAAAAGVAYGITGTFSWMSHAVINPVPFLPVILLGIERSRAASAAGRRFGWGLTATGIALALYGGFPEEAYWFIPVIGGWAGVRCVQAVKDGSLRRFLGKLVAGGVTGLALSAPLLVAFVTYMPHAVPPPHVPVFATASPTGSAISTQVVPYLYGPVGGYSANDASGTLANVWNDAGGYLDTSLVFFAIIGSIGSIGRRSGKERAMRIFLVVALLVSELRLIGFWPVAHLVGLLPGAWISFSRYAAPSWELLVALLAGLGISDVIAGRVSGRRVLLAMGMGAALIGVAYAYGHTILANIWHAPDASIWIVASGAWAVVLILASGGAARLRGKLGVTMMVGLVAMDACAMYIVPQLASQRDVRNEYSVVGYLARHLGTGRFTTLGPLLPNYGSYFKLPELNVEDIPVPRTWAKMVMRTLDPGLGLGGGLNYAFNFDGITFWQGPGAPTVEEEVISHVKAYERDGTKYVIVPEAEVSNDSKLIEAGFRKVWAGQIGEIFEFPHPQAFYSSGPGCTLSAVQIESVVVQCRKPGILVRRELYLPGWVAAVNGKPVSVGPRGKVFQMVRLPAGRSKVVFSFAPPHVDVGWLLLAAGFVFLGSGVVGGMRDRHRLALALIGGRSRRTGGGDPGGYEGDGA